MEHARRLRRRVRRELKKSGLVSEDGRLRPREELTKETIRELHRRQRAALLQRSRPFIDRWRTAPSVTSLMGTRWILTGSGRSSSRSYVTVTRPRSSDLRPCTGASRSRSVTAVALVSWFGISRTTG